jgi:hypothetical protein
MWRYVYGVEIDALIDNLMNDAPTDDALPLLAFALQRVWHQYAASGTLTDTYYKNFGGLRGLIEDAAERALRGIEPDQDVPLSQRDAQPRSSTCSGSWLAWTGARLK